MNNFIDLVQLCKGKKVYIQIHNFPDPDAIGSAFGLQRLLKNYEIDTTICYTGAIDKLNVSKMLNYFHIQMYRYEELKDSMKEEDMIICVDCQKSGGNSRDFIGRELACIDHHPTFVPVSYEFEELRITGACATLIAEYYQQVNVQPDPDVATALLYGLRMDTMQFSRGVTAEDIQMFGFLFPFCDREKLTMLERNNMELRDLRAYGAVIDSIAIYGCIGFAEIPFFCPDGLIATMADFILSLEEVTVAVVCCRRNDGIKVSVRSEQPEVHSGTLIREALHGIGDGGGHQEMAGGLIPKEVMQNIAGKPEELFRERVINILI